ncbi:MAG: hypothetical protein WBQ60_06795, partial [Asticcacaulis sp.]
MRRTIPNAFLGTYADVVARRETHATLNNLFIYACASGDPTEGSKPVKALEWLRNTNKDDSVDPLAVLAKIIECYMEEEIKDYGVDVEEKKKDVSKIKKVLSDNGLQYIQGGRISGLVGSPSIGLEDYIKNNDLES